MVAAGRQKPQSKSAPKIAAMEVGKRDFNGKVSSISAGAIAAGRPNRLPVSAIELGKQDRKDKTVSATARGKLAAGKRRPSSGYKSTRSEGDVKKQDDRGKANSASSGVVAGATKSKPSENQARKQDGKIKANSANSGEIAVERHLPLSAPKRKNLDIEVKKQAAKAKRIPSTPNSG